MYACMFMYTHIYICTCMSIYIYLLKLPSVSLHSDNYMHTEVKLEIDIYHITLYTLYTQTHDRTYSNCL